MLMKKLLFILTILVVAFQSCKETVETTSEISENLRPEIEEKQPMISNTAATFYSTPSQSLRAISNAVSKSS